MLIPALLCRWVTCQISGFSEKSPKGDTVEQFAAGNVLQVQLAIAEVYYCQLQAINRVQ